MSAPDVLVVGGGLAGLSAALSVPADRSVVVMSKVHPLRSHSGAAQGGINAPLGNHPEGGDDCWEKHAFDTVKGSDYLADQDAVDELCQRAAPTILDLDHLGVPFSRFASGVIAQRPFGGAGFPRTCYAADRTGLVILQTLFEHCLARGVRLLEEHVVTDLVVEDGRCRGVVAYDLAGARIAAVPARSVIFATGGYGRVFQRTTNGYINRGSGIGIAGRAGAPLEDMEFVQFHPTSLAGKNILITEGARGEGGWLVNRHGARFMEEYAPSAMELAPRDIVARAIESEIEKGHGFEGPSVHLDLRHLGRDAILRKLPAIRDICIHFGGFDPIDTPIPVQPAQHYSMGGIEVDSTCASPVRGLFAAGECACVSVHGANRLGGNSLLETVVFGRIAGESAGRYVAEGDGREGSRDPTPEAARRREGWIERRSGMPGPGPGLRPLQQRLKAVMSDRAGVFREREDLEVALREVEELRQAWRECPIPSRDLLYNQVIVHIMEFESMLDLAEAIALGGLRREETRGSHFRRDFPRRRDGEWMRHSRVLRDGDSLRLEHAPVTPGRYEPTERKY